MDFFLPIRIKAAIHHCWEEDSELECHNILRHQVTNLQKGLMVTGPRAAPKCHLPKDETAFKYVMMKQQDQKMMKKQI